MVASGHIPFANAGNCAQLSAYGPHSLSLSSLAAGHAHRDMALAQPLLLIWETVKIGVVNKNENKTIWNYFLLYFSFFCIVSQYC